ncbi:hypothetical protein ACFLTU_05940 [Bacteroidota bacterium]
MFKPLPKYLTLAVLIVLSATCKRKPGAEKMAEGKIRFKITYEQSQVGGYSTAVLPQEMIMEFRDDMVRNTIKGGLGFFNLVNVSDLNKYQNTTWLKFIDKKYIFEGEKRDTPCCFGMLDGMILEFTDSTKEIAGFHCKQVLANFPDKELESFDLWYTEEIELDNPNGNSPFMSIPGVLLEFNTLMGNANMRMIATKYEAKHIPPEEFQPPENYRAVTKAEMETILNALMN